MLEMIGLYAVWNKKAAFAHKQFYNQFLVRHTKCQS